MGRLDLSICCRNDRGETTYISINELVSLIGKIGFKNENPDEWMAKKGLYFNYPVCIDTNVGAFQKLYPDPAIVAYAKYRKSNGSVTGRVIFLSKSERGVQFEDLSKDLYVPYTYLNWQDERWYWTQSKECRLKGRDIRMVSNAVYDSLADALESILEIADVRPAAYRSFFPKDGESLMVLGAMNGDVNHAPFIFDNDGTLYCKRVVEKGNNDEN